MATGKIYDSTTSTWKKVDAGNADTVGGYSTGNASGNIPVSNGTLNTNLNADKVDGCDAGTGANNVLKLDSSAKVPIANLPTGTTSSTVSAGNHLHSGIYEPVDADIMRKDVAQTMTANLVANVGSDYTTKRVRNIVYKTGAEFTTAELGLGDLGCVY